MKLISFENPNDPEPWTYPTPPHPQPPAKCIQRWCNRRCQELGYKVGRCQFLRPPHVACICYGFLPSMNKSECKSKRIIQI